MPEVLQALSHQRVIPVIRTADSTHAIQTIGSLESAGMQVVELTMTIPDVFKVVDHCRQKWPHVILAMGTIRTAEQAQRAIDAGISLLITYKVSEEIAQCAQNNTVPYILGACTPSEVDQCLQLGSPIIKWFPASIGGPEIIRDLQGPMPEAQFFPTGGITLDAMSTWFAAGALAVGIGGDLIGTGAVSPDVITNRARKAIELTQHFR